MRYQITRWISFTIDWEKGKELINNLYEFSKALKEEEPKHGKRKKFTEKTKQLVLERQNNSCATCGVYLRYYDFHHIGNRSDNSPSNCEALCLGCHAKKTRKKKKRYFL